MRRVGGGTTSRLAAEGRPADGQAACRGRRSCRLRRAATRSRATGITAYLSNGGTLEHAQQIAGHASPKTTKLYDRNGGHGDGRRRCQPSKDADGSSATAGASATNRPIPMSPADFDAPGANCPVPTTHRRLLDAHNLWHQTADNYSRPSLFRTNLNATIQALRNITFAVQSEKHAFPDFDAWYIPWQTRMKGSAVLSWLKDARNTVVKQGDLDTVSSATVRLLTWKDDELAHIPIRPDTSSDVLLKNAAIWDLIAKTNTPSADLSSAVIEIERQWVLPGFRGSEALATLAAAYGLLSDLVVDAHACVGGLDCIGPPSPHSPFRATHNRSGTLPCMTAVPELRKERLRLSDGDRLVPSATARPNPQFSPAAAAARYGIRMADLATYWRKADPALMAQHLVYWSKRMLRRDKGHIRIAFVRDGAGEWHPIPLFASNRAEKHLVVRVLAQFVERTGADAVIDVGEAWSLPTDEFMAARVSSDLENVPGRLEALHVLVATRDGLLRTHTTPFSRGPLGGIRLEDTRVSEPDQRHVAYMHPVWKVWRAQGTRIGPGGERTRWLWEPDPLDRCYCGGRTRFASCCGPVLQQHSMDDLERLGDRAMEAGDLAGAESCARAVLAQYVMWVRTHTAPTRHVAHDLHEGLVALDVPALEACVERLGRVLQVTGRRGDLVAGLRHLSGVIGVPELSVRLTAVAARLLYEVGTRADAAAELDGLGDLDGIVDSLALRVAARVFDADDAECCRLLQRAVEHAENEAARCGSTLDLAMEYQRQGDAGRSLELVNDVIERTEGNGELIGERARALTLRWQLVGNDADFTAARRTLEAVGRAETRRALVGMLMDHGDLEEADGLLATEMNSGDVVVHLLAAEIRLRTNRIAEAEKVLCAVSTERVTERLRLPYAYSVGLVALAGGSGALATTAAAMLRCIESEEGGLGAVYKRVLEGLDSLQGGSAS